MNGLPHPPKKKFTRVILQEVEGYDREEADGVMSPEVPFTDYASFVIDAPLRAVVQMMNQPILALETLARLHQQKKKG